MKIILKVVAIIMSVMFLLVTVKQDAQAFQLISKPLQKIVTKPGGKIISNIGGKSVRHTIGGNSAVLACRLGIKYGTGYQAHHIIPVQLRYHPILNKIGFDMDQVRNGIALPDSSRIASHLPVHHGYHAEYNRAVLRDLDSIPRNLSISETEKRVFKIIEKYRMQIESGKPLYRNQGAPTVWK